MTQHGSWITGTLLGTLLLTLAACGGGDEAPQQDDPRDVAPAAERASGDTVTVLASGPAELSREELEAGRLDSSWKRYVEVDPPGSPARAAVGEESAARAGQAGADTAGEAPADTTGEAAADTAADTAAADTTAATWDDISRRTVNRPARGLPIHGDVEGPSVARVQILLDLNRFSPGVIDGRWGKNTEKAVYWFQKANGLSANGQVDRRTMEALEANASRELVTTRTITEADVSGPFEDLPEDVYARAEQPCLCYESQREQLGEVFHATPELLEQLNPGTDLNTVQAGQTLDVPAVDPFHLGGLPEGKYTGGGEIARVVISDGGHYVHAMDDAGRILYHFPSTLGADYAPSPDGEFSVESITFDPTWHYQPDLLSRVDPSREDAILPAGPNNAVGVVWMQLSKPHYGIHGTSAPETIGYATSHGCVRLTNWDAGFLGQRIPPGVPVDFRDVSG